MPTELEELCNDKEVTAEFLYGKAPAYDGETETTWKPAHNWIVILRLDGRQLETPFYGDEDVKRPKIADVIHSLLLDVSGIEESFEDWCQNFGLDTDSRRAERIYNKCREIAPKLREFLGSDYDAFARAEH